MSASVTGKCPTPRRRSRAAAAPAADDALPNVRRGDGEVSTPETTEPTAAAPAGDEAVPSDRRGDGKTPAPATEDAAPAADAPAPPADAAPAAPADDDLALEGGGGALPVDSPFDLPPMVQLQVGRGAAATAALQRAVLRSGRLALSPAVRQGVEAGRANAEALELLLRLGHVERPLLVWRARGGGVRVQATSLAGTRELVEHLHGRRRSDSPCGPCAATSPTRAGRWRTSGWPTSARRPRRSRSRRSAWPYSWGGGNAGGASTGTCNGYRGSIRPCPAERTVGFDCSGLMLFAYAQVGIKLDHYAAFQWLEGRRVDSTELVPGDVGGAPAEAAVRDGQRGDALIIRLR